ncbi:uncharacterized protein [Amphiura filiformis]|uniref:uncharacterized protein n=1 Tax=Amphiura filiformis TaxID=82378 RepID=UPI003B21A87B
MCVDLTEKVVPVYYPIIQKTELFGFMRCAGTTFEITETTGVDLDFSFCLCKGPVNPSGAKFFVTIDHVGADPTAADDFDEGTEPLKIPINNLGGNKAKCADNIITILGDAVPENTETFTLTLSFESCADKDNVPCMVDTGFDKITVDVVDDDSQPPVLGSGCDCASQTWYILDRASYAVTEPSTATGTKTLEITIIRKGVTTHNDGSVDLTVVALSASETADYVNFGTETINFAATEFMKTFDITINSDDLHESTEEFLIYLSNPGPTAATNQEDLGDLTTAVISIYDYDRIGTWYYLGCAEYTVTESDTTIDIVVKRRGDTVSATTGFVELSTTDITALSTSDNIDYTALTSVPVIFEEDATCSTPITLTITDDMSEEPLEHLEIALTLTAIADRSELADLNKAFVTIIDDDSKVTWYSLDCGFYTATEGDTDPVMIPITITKRGDLSKETTVSLTTMDITATGGVGLDYTIKSGEVITFTADTETVETSQLVILPDDIAEGNEYLQVELSLPSDAPVGDALSDLNKALVLIYDDDSPVTWYSLDCGFYTATEGDTDPVMIPITVTKRGDLSQETTVLLSTMDITATGGVGLDYTIKSGEEITFTADTETVETSQLVILSDDIAEGNEYLQVELSLPSDAPVGDALSDVNKALVLIYDDDEPVTWYSLDCGFYIATETDTDPVMIPITITKRGDLSKETTVLLSTMDITATGGVGLDYTIKSGEEITFTADTETVETSQLVILSYDIAEGNEYLQVELSLPSDAPVGDALSDLNKAVVLIYDDDEPVTWYSLDCGFYIATETDTDPVMIPITITKRGDLSKETTVLLSTMDITATGGVGLDYTIKSGEEITFTADTQTVETSQLVILSDDIAEGNEYLQVELSLPSDAPVGDALSDLNKALVFIYDDDAPVTWYSLDCGFYTATETDTDPVMITITITKRGDLSKETTVLLSTMDITATGGVGLDYTIKSGEEITFTANTETVETSQLVILSDDIAEGNEYLQVELSLPSDAPVGDALSDLNKALVLIYDDDEPVTWYSLDCGFYTATETDAGTVMIPITITKRGDLSQETTVLLSTMDITATGGVGLDYTIKSGEEITFTANTETVETSQLVILSDDIAEGNEYLQVELSLPSDAPVGDALSDLNKALVLIYDDDAPVTWYSLDCGFYTATENDAGTVMITITITKRGDLSQETTVLFSTMDITATGGTALDYTIKTDEIITFTANTETVETSQLVILSDDIAEGNEYLQVALNLPSSAPVGDALSDVNKALVIIYDDDTPVTWYSLDCGFYTATEGDSGTVVISITITKRGDLSQETTVLLSTMDITATGGDYTIKTSEIIAFTANTETVETSQLVILSDDIAEGNEYLQVALSLPPDAPVGDALSDLNKALVLIYDDDAPVCNGGNGCANNGICIGTDVCVCGGGFTGNFCQLGSASPVCGNGNGCANNGICIGTDACVCGSGFTGNLCQFSSASPCKLHYC